MEGRALLYDAVYGAIRRDDHQALADIIDSGKLDVNEVDSQWMYTLLGWALNTKRNACARLLLERGADPNGIGPLEEEPPLACAIRQRSANTVRMLLTAKADPALREPTSGRTALHYAARHDDVQCMRLLLSLVPRSLINAVTLSHNGVPPYMPLDVACLANAQDCGFLLIEVGARFHHCRAPDYESVLFSAFTRAIDGRERCRLRARLLYGVCKHRLRVGRDVAGLVARALWETRMDEAWQDRTHQSSPKK